MENPTESTPFEHRTASGRILHGLLDPARQELGPGGLAPVVVLCHGFKGFMEWGFFPYLAELLSARGFTVLRFNFSGTGMRPGDERVTDLAAFRANTFSREREELADLLAALDDLTAGTGSDTARVGLLGHSRGGAAVLGAAADAIAEPEGTRSIGALVTWSSIGGLDLFGPEVRERWRRDGELTLTNARTGQELVLGPELLAEIESPPPELELTALAARRQAPWLILHGEDDESVPLAHGRRLAEAAAGGDAPAELRVVDGGSHTFGARHPFVGPTPALITAMNATQSWFRRFL